MIKLGQTSSVLSALRSLDSTSRAYSSIAERLSSGMRITKASDDAAGLSIASALKSDVRIYTQAARNLSDGISMLSIASGALSQLSSIQTRIIELTEQAANGTLSYKNRRPIQAEVDALTKEMNRIISTTSFNGVKLLDISQSNGAITLQDGYGSESTLTVDLARTLARTTATGTFEDGATLAETFTSTLVPITTADLNNDSYQDILVQSGGIVYTMLGNGDGTFKAEQSVAPAYRLNSSLGILVDLNNDGILDMISTEHSSTVSTGILALRYGNGDGTFNSGISISSLGAFSTYELQYEDLNNDGIKDVSYSDQLSGQAVIHLGTATGTFSTATLYTGLQAASNTSAVGDLNGDGIKDIVIGSNSAANTIAILYGTGNNENLFSAPTLVDVPGAGSGRWVHSADFNRDGFDDLFITRWSTSNGAVMLSNGDGTFATSYLDSRQKAHITDFNGDGILDIIDADSAAHSFRVYTGNGDGTFAAASEVVLGSTANAHDIAVADFNNDGAPDIAAVSFDTPRGVYIAISDTREISTFAMVDVSDQEVARGSLDETRATLNRITNALGSLGAAESRIGAALSNVKAKAEVYQQAEARIMDADIAEDSAALIRMNMLKRIGAEILAHAKQDAALVLKLLS